VLAAFTASAALCPLALCPAAVRAQTGPAQAYIYVPLDSAGTVSAGGQGISGNRAVGYGYTSVTFDASSAYVWDAATGVRTALDNTGLSLSFGQGISGNWAVGYGSGSATGGGNASKAFVWDATTGARTTLDSTGLSLSFGQGISGNLAIGYGFRVANGNTSGAFVWDATTGARTALNSTGLTDSYGTGISGNRAVGYGSGTATGGNVNGLVWDVAGGTRTSLDSAGLSVSYATGISGNRAVGYGSGTGTGGSNNAFAWDATTGARTALNGTGLTEFYGTGISGNRAVGYGFGTATNADNNAFAWDATTGARTSLAPFLPGSGGSRASGISSDGSVTGTYNNRAFALRPVSGSAGSTVAAGLTARSAGDFTQTAGTNTLDGAFQFVNGGGNTYTLSGGVLQGSGTVQGSLTNGGGTVAPGNSPGTFSVTGAFTQLAGGTLLIELGGTSDGQIDRLSVGGPASLGGALSVALTGAFAPSDGQTWDILTAASITGAFTSVTPGFSVSVVPGAGGNGSILRLTAGTAAAVPESGTLALLPLGVLALVGASGRNRRLKGK
jgi:hypothetical protein